MDKRAELLSHQKVQKVEVYDWLRGFAALAVVLGHLKPFGIDKIYSVWSIQAFLLVTVALIAQKHLSIGSMVKKLVYVGFSYLCLFLIFRPLFVIQGILPALPLWMFFFDFKTVFIENPYFSHLWYLLIYVQLLVFLCLTDRWLKKWDFRWVLIAALILSNLSFALSYTLLERFPTLLLSSWFVTIASGFYLLPKVTEWMEKNHQYRGWRCLLSFIAFIVICKIPLLQSWLVLPDTRVSLLSTLVYFLFIHAAMELFFIVSRYPILNFVKQFVSVVSRYTLVIYIYHQALQRLLAPYAISMELLTLLSIVSGVFVGFLIQRAFAALDSFFEKMRGVSKGFKVPRVA